MDGPKISVIVPIYKVEPYLRKCLNSIVNQTYRNLEIILVDDGSPDNCGTICDLYAKNDDRIKVIHKENGGVSSARNAGLSVVTGEWIGWVDPDDWIELDMFEYMLEKAQKANTDIAVCSRYEHYRNQTEVRNWPCEMVLNTEDALKKLLENAQMQNFLWDKLWRRELFIGIWFPEGRTFEDIAIIHRPFERAKKILCLPETKYHYLQRPESIVGDVSLRNRINHYIAAKERYEEMKDRWPQFLSQLEGQCVASAINIWCSYLKNKKEDREQYQKSVKEVAQFAKNHYNDALAYMELGPTGKLVVCLTPYTSWWAFGLAWLCGLVYKMKHGKEL